MEEQFKNSIKNDLETLFSKYSDLGNVDLNSIISRSFVFSKTEKEKVLFIGINPSWQEGAGDGHDEKPYELVEADLKGYFKPLKSIIDVANLSGKWTYADILYIRERDQNKIIDFLSNDIGLNFICDQLLITMKILENCKPSLIVVCNRLAGDFFGINKKETSPGKYKNIWMGYEFEPVHSGKGIITGIHSGSINADKKTNLVCTPIIFSKYIGRMKSEEKVNLANQIKTCFDTSNK